MSKSIYKEALKDFEVIKYHKDKLNDNTVYYTLTKNCDTVLNALKQAQKQEKLLGHYKDLAEVRKIIHNLIVILKKPKDERLNILFTEEHVLSKIIRGLENEK